MPENTNYEFTGSESVNRMFRRCREMLQEIKRLGEVVDERNVEIERLREQTQAGPAVCQECDVLREEINRLQARVAELEAENASLANTVYDLSPADELSGDEIERAVEKAAGGDE